MKTLLLISDHSNVTKTGKQDGGSENHTLIDMFVYATLLLQHILLVLKQKFISDIVHHSV